MAALKAGEMAPEIELPAVKEDGASVAVAAAEAAGGVLDPLNLRVQCLGDRVRDRPTTPVEQCVQPALESLGQALHRPETTAARPRVPLAHFRLDHHEVRPSPLADAVDHLRGLGP